MVSANFHWFQLFYFLTGIVPGLCTGKNVTVSSKFHENSIVINYGSSKVENLMHGYCLTYLSPL